MVVRWCCDSIKSSDDVNAVELLPTQRRLLQLLCTSHFEPNATNYALFDQYTEFLGELMIVAQIPTPNTLLEKLETLRLQAKKLLFCASQGTRCDLLSRIISFITDDTGDATTGLPSHVDLLDVTPSTSTDEVPEGWIPLPLDIQAELSQFTTVGVVLNKVLAQRLLIRNVEVTDRDQALGNVSSSSIYYR